MMVDQNQAENGSAERGTSSGFSREPQERPIDQPRQGAEATRAIANLMAGREPDDNGEEDEGRDELAGSVLDGRSSDERGGEGEGEDEAPEPRKTPRKPRNLHEAAELLGIDAAELYDLEVPARDGSMIKLGALKDQHHERAGLELEIATKQTQLEEREGAIRGAETRLAEVYEVAKGAFPPAVERQIAQALDDRRNATMAREAIALSRSIPELDDEKFRDRFDAFLTKAGARYGFSPAELRDGLDHRHFVVLKDLMEAQARLDRLLSVKPKPRNAPGIAAPQGRGGQGDSAVARARASGKEGDVVRAVSSIMRGGRG